MSRIGEYWYTNEGDLVDADGDAGDISHEMVVLSHARTRILDFFDLDSCSNYICETEFLRILSERFDLNLDKLPRSVPPVLIQDLQDRGYPECAEEIETLWPVAIDHTDLRTFAIQNWNWIWICHSDIGVKVFNDDSRRRLSHALELIADLLSIDYGDQEWDETTLCIRTLNTGRAYSLSIGELASPLSAHAHHQPDFGDGLCASNTLRNLDRASQPACYANHLGD